MSTTSLPTTMRAWQYSSTKGGLPKNLVINSSTSMPKPKPDQHLVRVKAVALNPVDYKPAEIPLFHRFVIPKPATPGIDFVGTIVTPAAGSSLKPGQLVFGMGTSPFAGGMLSEFAVAGKNSAIALGDTMDPIDGAAIGVAGLTAYQSMYQKAKPGSRIFINGGSGGTGTFGIQIAKALGYEVTVSCSSRNVETCRSLGADEVIDYTKGPVLDQLNQSAKTRKYDLVIDNVFSPELYWKAHEYTHPGAEYVSIAGTPSLKYAIQMLKMRTIPAFLGGGERKLSGFFAQANTEHLTLIRTWFQEKKVRAVIDSRFAFEQAPQAFEKLKTGRAVGKIIVEVESSIKG